MTLDVNRVSFKGNEEQKSTGSNPILPAVLLGGAAGGGSYYGLTTPPTEDTFVKRVKDGTLNTDKLDDAQKKQVETLKAELDKTPAATTTDATTPAPVSGEDSALTKANAEATEAARKLRHQQEIANLELEQTKKMQETFDKTLTQATQKPLEIEKGETVKKLTAEKAKIQKGITHNQGVINNPLASKEVKGLAEKELKELQTKLELIDEKILPDAELDKKRTTSLVEATKAEKTKLLEEQKTAKTAFNEATTAKTNAEKALAKLKAELTKEADATKQAELTTKVAAAEKEVAQATESFAEASHKNNLITKKVNGATSVIEGLEKKTLETKLEAQKLVASLDDKGKAIGTAFTEVAEDGKLNRALNSAIEKVDSLSHNSAEATAKATRLAEARNKLLGITENAKATVTSVVEQLPERVKTLVTEAFEKVKGSLKSERAPGKAALIGAGVALATYIGFKMFGGSDKGEA